MEIYLDENYRVRTIPYNFVLEERVEKILEIPEECRDLEEGEYVDCVSELETKNVWNLVGYYGTFKGILNGYMHENMMRKEVEELDDILQAIEEVEISIGKLPEILPEEVYIEVKK